MQNYVEQNGLFRERFRDRLFSSIKSTLFKGLGFQHWIFLMYGKYVQKEQLICFIMADQLQLYLKAMQQKKTKANLP